MSLRTSISPPAVAQPPIQDAPSRHHMWQRISPYIYIGPAVVYLIIFMIIPVVQGIQLSFTKTPLVRPDGGTGIGLENYSRLLNSPQFYNSLSATILYTAATVIFAVAIGAGSALLLNQAFKGRTIVRAIITLPWAVPTVATALIFSWIFNRSDGVLNEVVGVLGVGQQGWLVDPKYGMAAVVLTSVWKVMPLVMLVVLASLQSIPSELYEATRMDGAGALETFKAVTWPHIAPTVRVVTLLMTIWSIRRFEIIYLLTGGGPVDTTNTLVVNVYRQAFSNQELGRAAAIGALGLVLSLLVTVVYFMIERRNAVKEA